MHKDLWFLPTFPYEGCRSFKIKKMSISRFIHQDRCSAITKSGNVTPSHAVSRVSSGLQLLWNTMNMYNPVFQIICFLWTDFCYFSAFSAKEDPCVNTRSIEVICKSLNGKLLSFYNFWASVLKFSTLFKTWLVWNGLCLESNVSMFCFETI